MQAELEKELAAARAQAQAGQKTQARLQQELGKHQAEMEQQASSLAKRDAELRDLRQSLANREADLAAQHKEIRASADALERERASIHEARNAVQSETAEQSELLELAESEQETLRQELTTLRSRAVEMEIRLQEALAARDLESKALAEAKAQIDQIAVEVAQERATVAECLSEVELREAALHGHSVEKTNQVAFVRQASHSAIASFWAELAEGCDGQAVDVADRVPVGRGEAPEPIDHAPSTVESGTDLAPEVEPSCIDDFEEDAEVEINQATAMREALEAARAEIEHGDDEPAPGSASSSFEDDNLGDLGDEPVKFTKAMLDRQSQSAQDAGSTTDAPDSVLANLDPETAKKLKMLKRLQPNKSEEELLAQIGVEKSARALPAKKRGWFSRR